MKLIFCPKCKDLFSLTIIEVRYCTCETCWGYYLNDGVNTVISNDSVPIGIQNSSFFSALSNRPKHGLGERFEAFVIPEVCDTIKREIEKELEELYHKFINFIKNEREQIIDWLRRKEKNENSFFPIKIQLRETNAVYIIETPEDLPDGQTFTVLETRVPNKK